MLPQSDHQRPCTGEKCRRTATIYGPYLQDVDVTAAKPPLTYRDAGVDIDAGNALVERIKTQVKRSSRREVMGGLGGFGALFDLSGKYREPVLVSGTDGVGTKLKLAQEWEVGMCVNDVLVQGAEPLFFLDYFATGKLDVDVAARAVSGIVEGCVRAGCALIGGETAEMPDMYAPGEYDLAGFCVGGVEKSKLLDGHRVAAGDVLLGIDASGPHSNGYSLIRRVLERAGASPQLELGAITLGDALMAPTTIYVKPILALLEAHAPHAMAHITGGGLVENIVRVIPEHLGIHVDASTWALPPVFDWLQREGGISNTEMWRTFNCGIGFVIVAAAQDVSAMQATLSDHGLASRVIGEVLPASGAERVRIG